MATKVAAAGMDTDKGGAKGDVGENRTAWRFLPIALVVAGLTFGYAMGWQHYLSLHYLATSREALKALVAANPVLAPLVFALLYVLIVTLSVPAAAVLTVFAGFLFGWPTGVILVVFSSTTGATLLFLAARTAFADVLRPRLGARAARLAEGFERDAFGYLLVLRLAPMLPFFIVNIAPAFFKVRLKTYVGATILGILPGTFAYTWLGVGMDSVIAAAQRAGRDVSVRDLATPQIMLAFVALALVAAIATVVRRWRGRATA